MCLGLSSATEHWHEISNNVVCATSKTSDQPAHMHSLIRAFASRLSILWLFSYWLNTIWSLAAEAHPSLHLSKCQIVGNLMPRLIYIYPFLGFNAMFLGLSSTITFPSAISCPVAPIRAKLITFFFKHDQNSVWEYASKVMSKGRIPLPCIMVSFT